MKKSVMVIVIAACLSGCAPVHKMLAISKAIEQDVNAGRVQGMKKYTAMTWNLPNLYKGPYTDIDDFNVTFIEKGTDKRQNATFFLGKSRETGKWEVFSAMIRRDGKWETVPVAQAR